MDYVCELIVIVQIFINGGKSFREGGNKNMEIYLNGYGLVMQEGYIGVIYKFLKINIVLLICVFFFREDINDQKCRVINLYCLK